MKELTLPAINIQAPWAKLIICGKKMVETRYYALPKIYVDKPMFIIETPGKRRDFKRRVVGIVTFSTSFQYPSRTAFYKDTIRHLVDEESDFAWKPGSDRRKWGWVVKKTQSTTGTFSQSQKTGIVFTKSFTVWI